MEGGLFGRLPGRITNGLYGVQGTAFRLRTMLKSPQYPRDILITFQNQKVWLLVLEAFRDQSEWKVEWFELLVFSDKHIDFFLGI